MFLILKKVDKLIDVYNLYYNCKINNAIKIYHIEIIYFMVN